MIGAVTGGGRCDPGKTDPGSVMRLTGPAIAAGTGPVRRCWP